MERTLLLPWGNPGKVFEEDMPTLFGIHLHAQHRAMGSCQPAQTDSIPASPGNGSPSFPAF